MIATKSDAQALSTMSTKIEDILAEHERIITSLRLRYIIYIPKFSPLSIMLISVMFWRTNISIHLFSFIVSVIHPYFRRIFYQSVDPSCLSQILPLMCLVVLTRTQAAVAVTTATPAI